MKRESVRVRLEDAFRASIEKKLEEYEDLFENADISEIETFGNPEGQIVFEVKRRIELTKMLAEDGGMDDIADRAKRLLESFE